MQGVLEVRQLRRSGYTLQRIASLLGVTRQFVGAIEYGRRRAPDAALLVLRRELRELGIQPPAEPSA